MTMLENRPHRHSGSRGVTLVELMVATIVMTIGVLGFFGAFKFVARSLYVSRSRILATNLAQEKIETLKNLTYYELLITTNSATDNTTATPFLYDTSNYPPETIQIGALTFTRETYVTLAAMSNNVLSSVGYSYPDTGLKQLSVYVEWTDQGTRKMMSLTNLLENPNVNPLDTGFTGNVTNESSGANLASALITTVENGNLRTFTDTSGNYSFRVAHGSYTIHVSSVGFQDYFIPTQSASAGTTTNSPNVALTPISSGTIESIVWISSHIVISQVVASTLQVSGFDAQYIELYNPTTGQLNIATAGGSPLYQLSYHTNFGGGLDCYDVALVYKSTYTPSYGYYLVANTSTFMVNGLNITADAYYADSQPNCSATPAGWSPPSARPMMAYGHSGSWLIEGSISDPQDSVGWNAGSGANYCEGTCIQMVSGGGFARGDQIVRISSPAATISAAAMTTSGHSYDSNNNQVDFYYPPNATSANSPVWGINYNPKTSASGTFAPIAGTPGLGTFVGTNDPFSGSTTAYKATITSGTYSLPYATFLLPVSTGSWSVDLASGSWYLKVATVTVSHSVESPIYGAFLSSTTENGFVKGLVTGANGQVIIPAVAMNIGNVLTTASATNGLYFASVSSGPITATANYNSANTAYIQQAAYPTVVTGQITTQDFSLAPGGIITGYVTSGTTPLPNITVVAITGSGSEAASGVSNTSGNFYISNITSGTYTVEPALDNDQSFTSSNANYTSITLTDNSTVFASSYTITGAFADIVGSITYNGSMLTTGALILVSASSLSSSPSSLCVNPVGACATSVQSLAAPVYAVSSKADGTYDVQVRGGSNYNMAVYIPTVTGSASVSVTTKLTYTGLSVPASGSTTQNVTVP